MEAVGLGRRVKAALSVHVELTVALTPIHWCAIEGVFAFCTLNRRPYKVQFEQNSIIHRTKSNLMISIFLKVKRKGKMLLLCLKLSLTCVYLLPVAVFPVTLRTAETGGGLSVVLAGASCAIMFITCVCMAITLTPAMQRKTNSNTLSVELINYIGWQEVLTKESSFSCKRDPKHTVKNAL